MDARSLEAGGAATGPAAGGSDGEEQRVGIRLRLERNATACWGRSRLLAGRMAGRRLVPWEALELVTAEVLSTIPVAGADAFEESEPATQRDAQPAEEEGSAEPEVPFLASLLEGLDEAEPHGAAWVARARRVSVRRLEDEVDHALATGELAPLPLDPRAEPQTGARPTVP